MAAYTYNLGNGMLELTEEEIRLVIAHRVRKLKDTEDKIKRMTCQHEFTEYVSVNDLYSDFPAVWYRCPKCGERELR